MLHDVPTTTGDSSPLLSSADADADLNSRGVSYAENDTVRRIQCWVLTDARDRRWYKNRRMSLTAADETSLHVSGSSM